MDPQLKSILDKGIKDAYDEIDALNATIVSAYLNNNDIY